MSYGYTHEYQSLVVSALVKDTTTLTLVRDAVKPEYFDLYPEQEIVRLVLEFYDKHHQTPSRDTILQIIHEKAQKLGWRDQDRNDLLTNFYRIFEVQVKEGDIEHVRDNVSRFGRIQALKLAMFESIGLIKEFEDGEKVELEDVERKIQRALVVGASKSLGIDLSEAMPRIREICKESDLGSVDRRIPTGFPYLDRITGGGPGGGEICFVIAPSNKGKSMMLVNMAAAAFRAGKKVIYFSFEMKEPEIASRLAANLTATEIGKVQEGDMSYQQKVRDLSFILETRKMKIIYVKPSEATSGNLRSIMMNLESIEGWRPDVIFVDYIDEMVPPSSSKRGDEDSLYDTFGKLTSELLSIGVDYAIPVWTASQVNRNGYTGEPTLNTAGRSMQKMDKAEFVITLIQNESQARENKLLVKILKNRRGAGVGTRIRCNANLAMAMITEEAASGGILR